LTKKMPILLVCLIALCAAAQTPIAELQFHGASFQANEIRFDPFSPVDWASVASHNFHAFDLKNPDLKQIEEKRDTPYGGSAFEYTAPFPVSSGFYYLLSSSGVVRIEPQRLTGTVVYPSDPTDAAHKIMIMKVWFSGQVSAVTPHEVQLEGSGFVMLPGVPQSFETSVISGAAPFNSRGIIKRKDGDRFAYFYNDGEGRVSELVEANGGERGVEKAYLINFSASPGKYLFVQWPPDSSTCNFEYSLYRLGDPVVKVADTESDCDI
jgi:hypothetical protein